MLNFFIKIKKVLSYITAKLKPRRTTFITILISNKATSFRLALPLIKKARQELSHQSNKSCD